jgi:hypothetical protein
MIKPAVEAASLKCIRADEIVHSGLIDVPMYEQLLKADVVVADLSTSNKNAYYELGNYTISIESYDKAFVLLGNLDEQVKSLNKNNVAVKKSKLVW